VEQSHRLSVGLRLTVLVFYMELLCDVTSKEITFSQVWEDDIEFSL